MHVIAKIMSIKRSLYMMYFEQIRTAYVYNKKEFFFLEKSNANEWMTEKNVHVYKNTLNSWSYNIYNHSVWLIFCCLVYILIYNECDSIYKHHIYKEFKWYHTLTLSDIASQKVHIFVGSSCIRGACVL